MNNNDSIKILIANNYFDSNSGVEGGAFKLVNCLNSIILNTIFTQNFAQIGGGIYMDNKGLYFKFLQNDINKGVFQSKIVHFIKILLKKEEHYFT